MSLLLSILDDETAVIFHRNHFLSDWNGPVPLSKRLKINTGGNDGEEGRKTTFSCFI